MEFSFKSMPLSAIAGRCTQAIKDFARGLQNDERYCLEIFRRALVDDNNDAWIALQEQFRGYVLYWFRCHVSRQRALQIDTEQNYVDDTFKRLWQWGYNQRAGAGHPEDSTYQAEFTNLRGALAFLKRCLTSLILDRIRADECRHVVPFPEEDPSTSSTVEEHLLGQEFWHIIETILTDARERRIIWLLYQQGLKPQQVLKRCPGEFESAQEIYRLTRNAIERLKRHGAIIRYKSDWEE